MAAIWEEHSIKSGKRQSIPLPNGYLFEIHGSILEPHPSGNPGQAGRKILCKRFSTKSRMALESRADSGLNPLITESHGGQNGMRAGTA